MRYRFDLGLRFHGPERLCDWCAELATQCSCKGPLTNKAAAAFRFGSSMLVAGPSKYPGPSAPRPTPALIPLPVVEHFECWAWCGYCKAKTLHLRFRCANERNHER